MGRGAEILAALCRLSAQDRARDPGGRVGSGPVASCRRNAVAVRGSSRRGGMGYGSLAKAIVSPGTGGQRCAALTTELLGWRIRRSAGAADRPETHARHTAR